MWKYCNFLWHRQTAYSHIEYNFVEQKKKLAATDIIFRLKKKLCLDTRRIIGAVTNCTTKPLTWIKTPFMMDTCMWRYTTGIYYLEGEERNYFYTSTFRNFCFVKKTDRPNCKKTCGTLFDNYSTPTFQLLNPLQIFCTLPRSSTKTPFSGKNQTNTKTIAQYTYTYTMIPQYLVSWPKNTVKRQNKTYTSHITTW